MLKRALCLILCVLCTAVPLTGCKDGAKDDVSDTAASENNIDPNSMTVVKNGRVVPTAYYQNPLEGSAADPMILKSGDTYYLYSTGGEKLSVRSSTDLVNWGNKKTIFNLTTNTTWGVEKCWAPEVYEYKGKFYLFFCGTGKDKIFHGSVAVCDTPDGTFKPITEKPLLNFNYSVIDLSFFLDDDGRTYIFYSKDCSTNKVNGKGTSQTWAVEVSNDFTQLLCDPVFISTPQESWELESGGTVWNEGPVVFKENGKYYLLYSANYYQSANYCVGYAVSDTVLSFYEKPSGKSGRLLYGNGETITGCGHCNIMRSEGEIYVVYHSHTVPPNTDKGRSLYIDKLVIKEDGSLYVDGPTNTKQPVPNGVNGYYKYDGEVTITGNLTKEQDLSILRDEILPKGAAGFITLEDSDTITLTFSEGQSFDNMWVYSTTLEKTYEIASMDIMVNGQYLYDDIKFTGAGSAPIINFANLPKGTLITEITFQFTKADGAKASGIGEIVFTTKK